MFAIWLTKAHNIIKMGFRQTLDRGLFIKGNRKSLIGGFSLELLSASQGGS